ncbi:MAG: hypothetical protein NW215_10805 [Hyphomicrobiales bacterium]|nr:hypothetical protein [Hyphomicrobiales bacterium]
MLKVAQPSAPVAVSSAPAAAPFTSIVYPVRVPLAKPIQTHQGEKREIDLREPNFRDWLECGDIQRQIARVTPGQAASEQAIEIIFDNAALARWMSALSGHDAGVLSQLTYADARRIANAVQRIVGDAERGNPETSPTSFG